MIASVWEWFAKNITVWYPKCLYEDPNPALAMVPTKGGLTNPNSQPESLYCSKLCYNSILCIYIVIKDKIYM